MNTTGMLQTEENGVRTMTAVTIGGRQLLVTAGKLTTGVVGGGLNLEDLSNAICAYDVNLGKLAWIAKGKIARKW